MKHESNLTSKGQVTIPKDIREALGLKPGQKVRFELDEDGDARIIKSDAASEHAAWLRRVRDVQRKFKEQDSFAGKDGLAYQRWIRESPEV